MFCVTCLEAGDLMVARKTKVRETFLFFNTRVCIGEPLMNF